MLKGQSSIDGSIAHRQHQPVESAMFDTNILNKTYFESYLEATTLKTRATYRIQLGDRWRP